MSVNGASTPDMSQPYSDQYAFAVEQRIYNLLRPFRNEQFELVPGGVVEPPAGLMKQERKIMVLSQNIGFLVHNHISNTEGTIGPDDVFVVMRGWTGEGAAGTGGVIAVLVKYAEGTMGVVKAEAKNDVSVIDALCEQVDEMLAEAF